MVQDNAVARERCRSACRFALALVTQAVAVQLIIAVPKPGYQNYEPHYSLHTNSDLFVLTFLASQITLVVAGVHASGLL